MSGDPAPTTGQQEIDGQPATATPPEGQGQNPGAGATAPPEQQKVIPQEQVDAIAARAREEGRLRLIKDLGFDDPKELKETLQQFREAEEAKLGETEKANKELEKRDKTIAQLQEANLDLIKEMVLIDLGLDAEQRSEAKLRLRGETREELADDAQKLAKLMFPNGAPPAAPPANVGAPTGPVQGNTGKSLEEQIREAELAGDFATAIALKGRLASQVQT